MKKIIIFLSLTIIFFIFIFNFQGYFFKENNLQASITNSPPIKLSPDDLISTVVKRDLHEKITSVGTIEYKKIYKLHALVSGKLKICNVKIGDSINKGDLLLEIDSSEIDNKIIVIEKEIEKLNKEKDYLLNFTSKELETEILLKEMEFKEQTKKLEREVEDLKLAFERGMVAKKKLVEKEKDFEKQKILNSLNSLKLERMKKVQLEDEEKLNQLIKVKHEDLEKLLELKKSCVISSPISGRIIDFSDVLPTLNSESNIVNINKGSFIMSIGENAGRCIKTSLFEKEASKIKEGEIVKFSVEGEKNDNYYKSKIKSILPSIQSESYGKMPVLLDIEENGESFRPQSIAICNFHVDSRLKVLTIPLDYLYYKNNRYYIYVCRNDEIKTQNVEIGIDNGEFIEIINGIKEGDMIVKLNNRES